MLGPGTRAALDEITTEEIRDLLAYGAEVAAITCSRAGANPPSRTELIHS
jgi:fructokinase